MGILNWLFGESKKDNQGGAPGTSPNPSPVAERVDDSDPREWKTVLIVR